MKPPFKSVAWLEWLLVLVGCLLALPFAAVATDATYISPAIVNTAPQVDATNFINGGVWNIATPALSTLPYQTRHTLNYTNTGTMNCSIGWEFDNGPLSSGERGWSANFYNGNSGTISALDGIVPRILLLPPFDTVSYLLISATNIVDNAGLLSAGPNGKMILTGSGVNLSRSRLQITPLVSTGSANGNTNFIPDTAIYDEFWGPAMSNILTVTSSPWDGTTFAGATFYNVHTPCLLTTTVLFAPVGPCPPQTADYKETPIHPHQLPGTNSDLTLTNFTVYSNIIRQAIFVYKTDANISVADHFGPVFNRTNFFRPAAVALSTTSTNVVTAALQVDTLYVVDTLPGSTNLGLAANLVINPNAACNDTTYRPASVVVARTDPAGVFASGAAGSGVPPSKFFYDSNTFSNATATGLADVYGAIVDNLAAEPPSGQSITNAKGYIHVYANNLNLSRTRLSAASQVVIQASNLVSSAGALIDCENLSYNLGATDGLLNFTNLALPYVRRFYGAVKEWSGVWTNYAITTYPSYVTNSTSGSMTESDITNLTEIDFAVTVVDASGLKTIKPVTVQDLVLHATSMIVSDTNIYVVSTLLFDGSSLTIGSSGGLNLITTNLQNWTTANAPYLRYFTNNGSLTIRNDAHFGDDGPTNYAAFVNTGTISAGSQTINSTVFKGDGSPGAPANFSTASDNFTVTTSAGEVQYGSIASANAVTFNAGTLKFYNATITAGNDLYFNVTNSLYDSGGGSGNVLTCNNGFALLSKPPTGDLLGTEIQTFAPEFYGVDHYWPGTDFGVSNLGYTNNEAVGQLVLNEGLYSQFAFHATSASNAIYVDLLDLSQCPDFLDPTVLTNDPNFVIYYAAAKLPSSFTNNSDYVFPQQAEEYLNGQQGGHLRWVSSFAGPNSSVAVLINGQTVMVNKALRYSKIIDSNGNGIPNYYDANPFDDPPLVLSLSLVKNNPPPAKKIAISWTAAPNMAYQVQYSTNFSPASWLPLLNYTNKGTTNVLVSVYDTNAVSSQRIYRVSHP